MKTIVTLTAVITILFSLSSCNIQKPISSTSPPNNTSYKVEYLFEQDGCKVYRFLDRGQYVYFTNCRNEVTSFSNDSTTSRVISLGN